MCCVACISRCAPFQQRKLVRVVRGAILDVVVDIRPNAPTFKQWIAMEITAEAWNQVLVPDGMAHGFLTRVADTEVLYKVSAPYSREHERTIRYDDPDLGDLLAARRRKPGALAQGRRSAHPQRASRRGGPQRLVGGRRRGVAAPVFSRRRPRRRGPAHA